MRASPQIARNLWGPPGGGSVIAMTNVVILRGGAPVKSPILVNVDDITITGDGSIENPLNAIGPAEITTEHIAFATNPTALDPEVTVSFVTDDVEPSEEATFVVSLADGSTDGQQKQVVVYAASLVTWRITPANFQDGDYVEVPQGEAGGALFTWNADSGEWVLAGTYNGTVT